MAPTNPAWVPPRQLAAPGPAVTPSPLPSSDLRTPVVSTNPPNNPANYRGYDRAPDPRNLQADNRNDAAGQYRNTGAQYDYRGNTIDGPAVRRDVPAPGYPRDPRYDNGGGNYPPASGPGSPLMPSGNTGPNFPPIATHKTRSRPLLGFTANCPPSCQDELMTAGSSNHQCVPPPLFAFGHDRDFRRRDP